jgi:hypothetical protein
MRPATKRKLITWLLMILAMIVVKFVIAVISLFTGMQINASGFSIVAAASIWFAREAEPLRAEIKRKYAAKDDADKWDE